MNLSKMLIKIKIYNLKREIFPFSLFLKLFEIILFLIIIFPISCSEQPIPGVLPVESTKDGTRDILSQFRPRQHTRIIAKVNSGRGSEIPGKVRPISWSVCFASYVQENSRRATTVVCHCSGSLRVQLYPISQAICVKCMPHYFVFHQKAPLVQGNPGRNPDSL